MNYLKVGSDVRPIFDVSKLEDALGDGEAPTQRCPDLAQVLAGVMNHYPEIAIRTREEDQ